MIEQTTQQTTHIGSVSKNSEANCLSGSITIGEQKYYIDIYPRNTDGKKWYSVRMKEAKPKVQISIDDIDSDLSVDSDVTF